MSLSENTCMQSPLDGPRMGLHTLDIIIVGAGLGGLATAFSLGRTGHRVTVLEGASSLSEVGAGIQLGPNATRLLVRWGLGPKLKEVAVVPSALSFRRYDSGEMFGYTTWGPGMEDKHGAPYYHIHRADMHTLLYALAEPYMKLHLSSRVESINATSSRPSVTLENGQTFRADLIIGADGVRSVVRDVVLGRPDRPVSTGDAAYRAIVPTSEMTKDPDLKELVDRTEMAGWLGPSRHIMTYCVRSKEEFNMVMLHPDRGVEESYSVEGCVDMMRQDYDGWDPRIQKLLALIKSTLVWPLKDRPPLKSWVHPKGRITLLGDACHPMLPYRAQGSAMAIEDAAALGILFSHLTHPCQIPTLLQAYEQLRLPRTAKTQLASRYNQYIFHMPDGPDQQERDRSMKAAMMAELSGKGDVEDNQGNPNVWADKEKNREQFDYDAELEAEKWWIGIGKDILDADVVTLARKARL